MDRNSFEMMYKYISQAYVNLFFLLPDCIHLCISHGGGCSVLSIEIISYSQKNTNMFDLYYFCLSGMVVRCFGLGKFVQIQLLYFLSEGSNVYMGDKHLIACS